MTALTDAFAKIEAAASQYADTTLPLIKERLTNGTARAEDLKADIKRGAAARLADDGTPDQPAITLSELMTALSGLKTGIANMERMLRRIEPSETRLNLRDLVNRVDGAGDVLGAARDEVAAAFQAEVSVK